jgi:hypothetical protein
LCEKSISKNSSKLQINLIDAKDSSKVKNKALNVKENSGKSNDTKVHINRLTFLRVLGPKVKFGLLVLQPFSIGILRGKGNLKLIQCLSLNRITLG